MEGADGFAEVFPEHKFEIVKILQVSESLGLAGWLVGWVGWVGWVGSKNNWPSPLLK